MNSLGVTGGANIYENKSPEGVQYLRVESLQDSGSPLVVAPHFVRGYSDSATLWQEELQLFQPKHYFIAGK